MKKNIVIALVAMFSITSCGESNQEPATTPLTDTTCVSLDTICPETCTTTTTVAPTHTDAVSTTTTK